MKSPWYLIDSVVNQVRFSGIWQKQYVIQSQRLLSDGGSRKHDVGVLDGFHITPLNDTDMPQRSRMSFLSTEMTEAKQIGVRGLSCYGFRMIDGSFLYGPVALFPRTALSWRVNSPSDITPQSLSLFTMLEPKIDILVIGVGDRKNIDKKVLLFFRVRAKIATFLKEHAIGLEIADTEDAISIFNFLNAEGRYVAAGLYPPDDMVVTDAEYGIAMNFLKPWDSLEENPLLIGLNDSIIQEEDVIGKIWNKCEVSKVLPDKCLAPTEKREEWHKLSGAQQKNSKDKE